MPSDEFFDVVNDRDEVVGRAARREVHARKLLHRAVHILVFDRTGRIFLQKRSMLKDMSPGLWDSSCSGHVDAGEDYDTAAVRELGEELGLKVDKVPERWFSDRPCEATGWEFVWVYRMQYDGPFVLHPQEIERGGWFTVEELTRWLKEKPEEFAPAFRLIWGRASVALAGSR